MSLMISGPLMICHLRGLLDALPAQFDDSSSSYHIFCRCAGAQPSPPNSAPTPAPSRAAMAPLGGLLTRPMRRLIYRGVALFVIAYFLWRPSADVLRWLFGTSSVSPFRSRRASERGSLGGSLGESFGALSTRTDDEVDAELPLVTGPVVTPPSLVWVLLGSCSRLRRRARTMCMT